MVLAGLALLANLFSPLSKISLFNAHSNRFASELGIRQVLSTIVDVSTPNGEQSRASIGAQERLATVWSGWTNLPPLGVACVTGSGSLSPSP